MALAWTTRPRRPTSPCSSRPWRAAAQLGYQPAGDYAATVAATVDWLVAGARGGPEAGLLPTPADEYFARFLDSPAEDRYLAGE